MPEWLSVVVAQFPVATVVGLVAWFAYREVRVRHTEEIKRLEENRKADKATLETALNAHLASKDAEIARLATQHRADMQKLTKKVDELAKRLDDRKEEP